MREPGLVGVAHRDAVPGAKAGVGLVRAGQQGVDGERGRGVGVGQRLDGGPLVLAQRAQEAGAGQGAQQGVAQDVGGERGTAGGFGFLLLEALLLLQLLLALAFGVCRELVLDHGVGVRGVHAAGVGEQLHDARPLRTFGRAALIVGQVLAVAFEVPLQPGFLEGGRRLRVGHAVGTPADRATPDLRPVDRLAGRGRAVGGCSVAGAAGSR
ncbi:hypothetical protein ACFYWX_43200 [Streptomyces sp. NPDC002888]|uniref:hypothetical protein n=1 Tax=Streptomyces sp. NPDC002888 TaxID=3364668 RepID=UPI0036CC9931